MIRRSSVPTALLLAASGTFADYLAMDFGLQGQPPGWFADGWDFSAAGAHTELYASSPWQNLFSYLDSGSEDVFIPIGADSVLLDVQQDLVLDHTYYGHSKASILYRLNGGSWIEVWAHTSDFQTTTPVHVVIPAAPPCTVGIRFMAEAHAGSEIYGGTGYVEWTLENLTLTVYGDVYSLDPVTWGGLKLVPGSPAR